MNSTEEIVYAAGIIDGEGCVSAYMRLNKRSNGSRYARIKVVVVIANTDLRLMHWLKERFGFSNSSNLLTIKPNHKPRFQASLESNKARDFLTLVLPYLLLKREQAMLAIEIQEHINATMKGRYVVPRLATSPEECDWRRAALEKLRILNKRGL